MDREARRETEGMSDCDRYSASGVFSVEPTIGNQIQLYRDIVKCRRKKRPSPVVCAQYRKGRWRTGGTERPGEAHKSFG